MRHMSDQRREPLISVIIVTWNCRDYVLRCLETVYASQEVSFEIIVRDNGSQDGASQAIQEKYPLVKLIGDSRNVGFAAANNEAISEAIGQYLLLLNPDTEIPPTALRLLVNVAETHRGQVVTVPTLLNSDGTIQGSLHSFPTMTGVTIKALARLKRFLRGGGSRKKSSVDWVKGACLLIPKSVYQIVGKLDDTLFMYGEDLDYCWRIHQAGFDIIWVPQVQIIHHGNVSGVQKWGDQRLMRTNQALIYFWVKHFGPVHTSILILFRIVYLLIYGLLDFVRAILLAISRSQPITYPERLLSSIVLTRASLDINAWRFYLSSRRQN